MNYKKMSILGICSILRYTSTFQYLTDIHNLLLFTSLRTRIQHDQDNKWPCLQESCMLIHRPYDSQGMVSLPSFKNDETETQII